MIVLKYPKMFFYFMGLKKFLGDAKDKIDEMAEKRRIANAENERIRLELERTEKEYADKVIELLDKFEISNFSDFLKRYLNKTNIHNESVDDYGNIQKSLLSRKEYVEYVFDFIRSKEINYDHLKDFALKTKLVVPSFFGLESNEKSEGKDFENIINSIKADFQPEKIRDEKELQSQLTIFIKAKFPDLKIQREVVAKSGDLLDILIDDNYVLELKVPKNRTHLRNLSAQVEEYADEYPQLCVVLADISDEVSISNDGTELEARLTEHIKEYADKYRSKYNVPSIILNVGMRA